MTDGSLTRSYDVALSFSGEDRVYVANVATALKAHGMTVFYDADEQATLWGEDLYVYLDKIYRRATHYCVMFISRSYAERLWTRHERMSTLSSLGEARSRPRSLRSRLGYHLHARRARATASTWSDRLAIDPTALATSLPRAARRW